MDQGIHQIKASQAEDQELQRRRMEAMKSKICFGKSGSLTWGLNEDCWTCILRNECKSCPWLSQSNCSSYQEIKPSSQQKPKDEGTFTSVAFQNAVAANRYVEAWKLLDIEDTNVGRIKRKFLHL